MFNKLNFILDFTRKVSKEVPNELVVKICEALYKDYDVLLLEPNRFNITLEMNNIVLDEFDYEYMMENALTEEYMKKLKALANFINHKK